MPQDAATAIIFRVCLHWTGDSYLVVRYACHILFDGIQNLLQRVGALAPNLSYNNGLTTDTQNSMWYAFASSECNKQQRSINLILLYNKE
jgi:hypothetical protein